MKNRLEFWPTDLNINRDHLLIKDYQHTKFEATGAKRSLIIRYPRCGRLTWPLTLTFDLLTENHQLIKDYLPTKFEASRVKSCWVTCINCTRCGRLTLTLTLAFDLLTWITLVIILLGDRPTYLHTNRHVQSNMPLLLRKGA